MRSISIKLMLASLALGAAIFALAGTASADPLEAEITVPSQIPVGEQVQVKATLRSADTGLAVPGTIVTYYADASFGGVNGEVELGQAVTDENGVAVLEYQPRMTGIHQIRIEYLPPGQEEPEVAATAFSVAGNVQLYRSVSGVEIPGLNVWLLITVVATVWAILFFGVAVRVVAIARAGQ